MNELSIGLEGVAVAETEMSHVDGGAGRLLIRGHEVEEIAGKLSFEECAALLWTGSPNTDLRERLGKSRAQAWHRLLQQTHLLSMSDPMDAIRGFVGSLETTGDSIKDALLVSGAIPVIAGAWSRHQNGEKPVEPDPEASHAGDYLRMICSTVPCSVPVERTGYGPDEKRVDALDAYLVTVIDHGLNASTFAARVVASTRSDMISAITAAIGALKGPLHGGAPGPVLDMLDQIGKPGMAKEWIQAELDNGKRIMGMGHRIYRVRDPRALVLERLVDHLSFSPETANRIKLAKAVETAALTELAVRKPDRKLCANVEFFTAVLLEAIGLPRNLFSPTFAVGRVAGWCAHVIEEQERGRLIRPAARYIGPLPVASHGIR
ncbi:MAG: citrate synthase/methylcitrate synthase [Verrucomicrobiales bacterium]|nr:citrate synthase/methylcitrate synthase [Verrucomicrobiales bacterium]